MQTSYTNMAKAFAGMLAGYGEHAKRTYHNDLGSVPQIVDVVITAANSTPYLFTVDGIPVGVTSAAAATVASIRDQLIDRFRAIPELEDIAFVNPSGNNVRVTAKTPGTPITVAEADANLALTTVQANVASAEIPFGRMVCRRTGTGTTERSAHLPPNAVAQVSTVTFTAANSTLYALTFRLSDGRVFYVEATSDATATDTEIRDAIEAAMISQGVPITPVDLAANGLTLTGPPGVSFTIEENPTASIAQATTTVAVIPIPLGISERVHSVVDPKTPGHGVGRGLAFSVVHRGAIHVEVEEAVADTDQVFFRHTASGVNTALGRFRNDSDGGTCIELLRAKFRKGTTGAGVAELELNLP